MGTTVQALKRLIKKFNPDADVSKVDTIAKSIDLLTEQEIGGGIGEEEVQSMIDTAINQIPNGWELYTDKDWSSFIEDDKIGLKEDIIIAFTTYKPSGIFTGVAECKYLPKGFLIGTKYSNPELTFTGTPEGFTHYRPIFAQGRKLSLKQADIFSDSESLTANAFGIGYSVSDGVARIWDDSSNSFTYVKKYYGQSITDENSPYISLYRRVRI